MLAPKDGRMLIRPEDNIRELVLRTGGSRWKPREDGTFISSPDGTGIYTEWGLLSERWVQRDGVMHMEDGVWGDFTSPASDYACALTDEEAHDTDAFVAGLRALLQEECDTRAELEQLLGFHERGIDRYGNRYDEVDAE